MCHQMFYREQCDSGRLREVVGSVQVQPDTQPLIGPCACFRVLCHHIFRFVSLLVSLHSCAVSYPGIQILSLGGVSLFFCPNFFFSMTREHSELYIFFFCGAKKTKKNGAAGENFFGYGVNV